MEIFSLKMGATADIDASFAEGAFSEEGSNFFAFAVTSGELTLLVRSDISLFEIMDKIQENGEDLSMYDYDIVSWNEDKGIHKITATLDIETLLANCMDSGLESYQCWYRDGNEGLSEACESESGFAFVLVHDLTAMNNFHNVRTLLNGNESAEWLLNVLDGMSTNEL